MNILQLTLKKKWFNLILSGEKTEEYREVKKYWIARLTTSETRYFLRMQGAGKYHYKKFDAVQFTNGYGKDKPIVTFECKGIEIGKGKKELGASDDNLFIIKLGEELSRKNI